MNNERVLEGRVAVVTGASRGIGAAVAKRFAAEGAKLVIAARTLHLGGRLKGSLTETAEAIKSMGGECLMVKADLSDPTSRASIIGKAVEHFGRVDILVNNAAWQQNKPIWEFQAKHLQLAFQINVQAAHDLSREVFHHMKSQGGGWIINISSGTAIAPAPAPYDSNDRYTAFNRDQGVTIYGTTKAALDRLTSGWAIEAQSAGVAVNSLAPVAAVASEGALALGGWDKNTDLEPQETMAEAALQLSYRSPDELTGRVIRSLPLLEELGIATKGLDGKTILKDYDFSIS